jgi:hypothetical protein
VTGLDANNKSIALFDSRMTLASGGPFGIESVNLWVTDTYPPCASFTDDTSATPVGLSPLDIANSRLIACDRTGVSFRWKDYRADGRDRQKVMTWPPASSSAAS